MTDCCHQLLQTHLKEMFSVIYTPTEGEAIQNYSRLFRKPEGCFLNIKDQDHIDECLSNFGNVDDVDYIVVSDGEEVLSLRFLLLYDAKFIADLGYRGSGRRRHPHFGRKTRDYHSLCGNSSFATAPGGAGLRDKCASLLVHP